MRIILAPAKKMQRADDDFAYRDIPVYVNETEKLLAEMRSMSYEQLKKMWKCSDQIARANMERLSSMNLHERLSPAVFTYIGLAYQHLSPGSLTQSQLEYLQSHLRILSGFYGVLKPFDGVTPYRLEMQAVLPETGDLYSFWNHKIYDEVISDDGIIINLASKEYSSSVSPFLKESDRMIDIIFCELKNGKPVQKGTMAKMARGEMTYWMAENGIEDPEKLKEFSYGYTFRHDLSDENQFVFARSGT